MPLTNDDRGPALQDRTPRVRATYAGLCRCGTAMNVSITDAATSPTWTPVGTIAWLDEDVGRDGFPKVVAVDHADCERPPSRLARDRSRNA